MYEILDVVLKVTIPNVNIDNVLHVMYRHKHVECPIKAFSRMRYIATYNDDKDLVIEGIHALLKKSFSREQDTYFWMGIAKYVKEGSYILWRSMNDDRWRYRFDGKSMVVDTPSDYVISELPRLIKCLYDVVEDVGVEKKFAVVEWIKDVSWVL